MSRGQPAVTPSSRSQPLGALPRGTWARVLGHLVEPAHQSWLEAMGLGVGETLMVLRGAPFGGPLHVRTGQGAELAVDREVAGRIEVAPCGGEPA